MNKFSKTIALAFSLAAALASANALAAKIAVVDVQAAFQQLPQAAMIQEDIQKEFADEIQAISGMEKDLKYYMEKHQRDSATMSDKEKEELVSKITKLREDYTERAKPLQMNVQRRQGEERNKILALIKQTIDAVAAEEKYDIVLRADAVTYMASAAENDITGKVVDKVSKIR